MTWAVERKIAGGPSGGNENTNTVGVKQQQADTYVRVRVVAVAVLELMVSSATGGKSCSTNKNGKQEGAKVWGPGTNKISEFSFKSSLTSKVKNNLGLKILCSLLL